MSRTNKLARTLIALGVIGLLSGQSQAAVSLLVGSVGTNSIDQYDGTTGAFIRTFATDPGLDAPFGMAMGPDLNNDGTPDLYVVSLGKSSVIAFEGSTGAKIATFVPSGSAGLQFPNTGVFNGGFYYLTDFTNNRVMEFNGDGTVHSANFINGGPSQLQGPTGLVFDPATNHYLVSSSTNSVLKEYNRDGSFFGSYTDFGQGGLSAPAGLVLPSSGTTRVWASSFGNNTVIGYKGVGFFSAMVDHTISGNGLSGPAGLALDASGNLYVGNSGGNDVLEFDATGNFIKTFVAPGAGGLKTPIDLLFTSVPAIMSPGTPPVLQPESAPEPSSVLLLGLGAAGLIGYCVRQRRTVV